jgi:hypothetical protein
MVVYRVMFQQHDAFTHLLQPPSKLQLCPRSSSALVAILLMMHKRTGRWVVFRAKRPIAAACLAALPPTVRSIRPRQHNVATAAGSRNVLCGLAGTDTVLLLRCELVELRWLQIGARPQQCASAAPLTHVTCHKPAN